jgi:hypothetical protein
MAHGRRLRRHHECPDLVSRKLRQIMGQQRKLHLARDLHLALEAPDLVFQICHGFKFGQRFRHGVDRNGDGFRERPDGTPLTVVRATLPESWYREVDLLWKKNMEAIGIRMNVQQQTFAELLNLSLNGNRITRLSI